MPFVSSGIAVDRVLKTIPPGRTRPAGASGLSSAGAIGARFRTTSSDGLTASARLVVVWSMISSAPARRPPGARPAARPAPARRTRAVLRGLAVAITCAPQQSGTATRCTTRPLLPRSHRHVGCVGWRPTKRGTRASGLPVVMGQERTLSRGLGRRTELDTRIRSDVVRVRVAPAAGLARRALSAARVSAVLD